MQTSPKPSMGEHAPMENWNATWDELVDELRKTGDVYVTVPTVYDVRYVKAVKSDLAEIAKRGRDEEGGDQPSGWCMTRSEDQILWIDQAIE